jgi:hypothetical protein
MKRSPVIGRMARKIVYDNFVAIQILSYCTSGTRLIECPISPNSSIATGEKWGNSPLPPTGRTMTLKNRQKFIAGSAMFGEVYKW